MNLPDIFLYLLYTSLVVLFFLCTFHFLYSIYDIFRTRRYNTIQKILGIVIMFFSLGIGNVIYGLFFTQTYFLQRITKISLKLLLAIFVCCGAIYLIDPATKKVVRLAYNVLTNVPNTIANLDLDSFLVKDQASRQNVENLASLNVNDKSLNTKKAAIFQNFAIKMERDGFNQQAYEAYGRAHKLVPELLLYRIQELRILAKLGNKEKSYRLLSSLISDLNKKINLNPSDHVSLYYLSYANEYIGELDEAKKYIKKAIKLNNNKLYRDRLGLINNLYRNLDNYHRVFGRSKKSKEQRKLKLRVFKKTDKKDNSGIEKSGLEALLEELEEDNE